MLRFSFLLLVALGVGCASSNRMPLQSPETWALEGDSARNVEMHVYTARGSSALWVAVDAEGLDPDDRTQASRFAERAYREGYWAKAEQALPPSRRGRLSPGIVVFFDDDLEDGDFIGRTHIFPLWQLDPKVIPPKPQHSDPPGSL